MKFRKKHILIVLLGVMVFTALSLTYYTKQVNSLTKLGYTSEEARKKVNVSTIYNIVTREKKNLKGSISKYENELLSLGLTDETLKQIDSNSETLISKINLLKNTKEDRESKINTNLSKFEKQATKLGVKYSYPDEKANCYDKYVYLKNYLTKEYNNLIKKYKKYLLANGYTNDEIKKMIGKSKYNTVKKLKNSYSKEKKQTKENNGFANSTLKNNAMRMFRETNAYRKSLGLKPYKYNYSKQSCVFKEAKAYASNKNPHNWLCPCANENAALASSSSDYVKVAMDFFKNDPPHEAVLSGNHNSVAIAFVEKDGMVYMIMDVFN